jgi:alpha-1,6-mannosyltransferase
VKSWLVSNWMRWQRHRVVSAVVQCLLLGLFVWAMIQWAGTNRTEHVPLFGWYVLSFLLYVGIGKWMAESGMTKWSWSAWLILIAVLALKSPVWSEDVYRFMWDGRMSAQGVNPYQYTPADLARNQTISAHDSLLLQSMNSPDYYSVYPPVKQFFFYLSAWLSPETVQGQLHVLKAILVLGILISALAMHRLLRDIGKETSHLHWFLFNPLLLTETLVNGHFEIWQLAFLLLSIWLLVCHRKWLLSAFWLGMASLVKLLPLIFLPIVVRYLGWRKGVAFSMASLGLAGLAFLPFYDGEMISNMSKSINLYFVRFEFNAFVYYLFREAGYAWKGYNMIAVTGPLLAILLTGILLWISLRQRKGDSSGMMNALFWALSAYFFLATTVHPWYIITVLGLGILVYAKTAVLWTFLTFFSYHAYTAGGVKENVGWSIVSYLMLLSMHLYWYGGFGSQGKPVERGR